MRHIVGLAGCLLVLSCTVNNDNLNADAGSGLGGVSGSGGITPPGGLNGSGGINSSGGVNGSGGINSSGGVNGSGGINASGGVNGSGGAGGSGAIGSGGVGGCPRCVGTGGVSATGGQVGTGGQTATGGKMGTGGSATGGHGAGGSGTGGGGGQGGSKSCGMIESDYGAALTAAKKCTPGAANQCQELVNSSLSCPGCKQYVNDTTGLDAIQTEWEDQNCGSMPHACPAIACLVPTASVCTSGSNTTGGPNSGVDPTGVCTNAQLTPAN